MEIQYIKIRPAIYLDAKPLTNFHIQAYKDTYNSLLPDNYLNNLSKNYLCDIWQKRLNKKNTHSRTFIALDNETIIGYISAGPSLDHFANNNIGECYSIYVAKNYKNIGIGKKLISEADRFLKERQYTKNTLWTLESNVKAINFFKQNGWMKNGREINYLLHKRLLKKIQLEK